MTKPLRTQFVVADGSRARWVRRNETDHDFHTFREQHAKAEARGGPQGVVFESSTGRRATVTERDTAVKARQGRFPEEIAKAINAAVEAGEVDRLALVAPTRTLAAITRRLTGAAQALVCGSLAKDLSKVGDHELGHWLRSLELG
jgi:protein required for attachment to host cells